MGITEAILRTLAAAASFNNTNSIRRKQEAGPVHFWPERSRPRGVSIRQVAAARNTKKEGHGGAMSCKARVLGGKWEKNEGLTGRT